MWTYDDMRKIIADHLSASTNQSRALDTAIMAACKAAYEAGRKAGRDEAHGQGTLPLDEYRHAPVISKVQLRSNSNHKGDSP